VSGKLLERNKRSVVLEHYSASNHSYVLHEFRGWAMPRNTGLFKFSTKDIVPETFLRNLDNTKSILLGAQLGEVVNHKDSLRRIIKETCEISLKKVFAPRGSRNPNYWWNDEIARLQEETFKKRGLAQRSRRRNKECVQLEECVQSGISWKPTIGRVRKNLG
jgi:hypothetical protein